MFSMEGHEFVVWIRLLVVWYNVDLLLTHKFDARCILPSTDIDNVSGKVFVICFYDGKSDESSLNHRQWKYDTLKNVISSCRQNS
jgi:hypothetical protein